ncbi:MAG: LytR/AlgR family response regulator transcription factor [Longimicrobiales bacterium]
MTLRVLIVDDEPIARRGIATLLQDEEDIEVIGQIGDGRAAVEAIRALEPDIVFLDVQMPELDGFDVVDAVGTDAMGAIVFVTAYDAYAIRAFEVSAVDYLLKPFDRERFVAALDRARKTLRSRETGELHERVDALLRMLEGAPAGTHTPDTRSNQRMVIKDAGRVMFVRPAEIDWVDAAGNYVCLHVGKDKHLLRETMAGMAARLDPDRFIRISRSMIVNIDRIKEVQPLFNGSYTFVLQDGVRLESSRRYRQKLAALFSE